MIKYDGLVYFSHDELSSPDIKSYKLHDGFGKDLLALRLAFNHPIIINSAARTEEYNAYIGGHPKSLHIFDKPNYNLSGAIAVDVYTPDAGYRTLLIKLAIPLGWSVGLISNTAVHLDMRSKYTTLPQRVFPY